MKTLNPSDYKFETLPEMIDMIQSLGYNTEKDMPDILINISRTPFESLWGSSEVNYGNPPTKYTCHGFGPIGHYVGGSLPELVILVRKDVSDKLRKDHSESGLSTAVDRPKDKQPLIPKNWKPAPGFEDFRT
jgi:hypothetical protein